MTRKQILNRREFLGTASIAAVGTAAWPRSLLASSSQQPRFGIVGSMGHASGLHLYSVRRHDWQLLQDVPVKAPVSMLLHPNQKTLYVLNQIDEHEGLPRGTVEAYQLKPSSGEITLLTRQPLSLSAIAPRHMALSPEGTSLVVAVAGGGAYNVLPVFEDGRLGRVLSQRKETGSGPVPGRQAASHPQAIVFVPDENRMIASDLGSDRLSVFFIEPEIAQGLELTARLALPPGSGPRNLALHPGGKLLFVDHALTGALSVFERNGSVLTPLPDSSIQGPFGEALVMHPSGNFLYAAGQGSITALHIDASAPSYSTSGSGPIHALQSILVGSVRSLALHPSGALLSATTPNGVLQFDIATTSGRLANPQFVASIPGAHSILFL
jgi:6-phosphogluconolactonase